MSRMTSFVQKYLPGFYRRLTLRMVDQRFETAPFTRLGKPVAQCRFALVSTGGFYLEGQKPFAKHRIAECSFREIPLDTPREKILIAHAHYDHRPVKRDLNVMLPRDRMRELQEAGEIGGLVDPMISFMGAILRPERLIRETAPEAARILKSLDADAALLSPA